MRRLASAGLLLALALPSTVRADAERVLASVADVRAACLEAQDRPASELLAIEVAPGWSFGTLDEEGFLAIDPHRNFRAINGHVELFPSRFETVGLVATPERVAMLEEAREHGARLRIGFFLGFDEPDRSACLVRSRLAISTVRMDVAYVELVAEDGTVVAREDTDRYRSWRDDHERDAVPGHGPRAALGDATTPVGPIPDAWQQGIASAATGPVGAALGACHRDGVARGAEASGRVIVRLRVDGRTGRVVESALAISDLGDTDEAECIATALRAVVVPPGPAEWGTRTVDLSVPVRLVAD